ncbi:MAG: bifunctional phosphopantothenoylcysteine decarboxylase/phosphopantothenate--cysteine ligase CoaBC [Thermoplasmata archaeon HGW-Thermoplasmata-1]|nr:MAG: bifunctional phosphopantothenoylcysteine decarboxylase/phosphopantothenate--cysteine ligase CoaBC [Thermoplasmata archaeon HGW-Thermoplasmata-1]
MHPINEIRGSRSDRLEGKKIVLGITGSIAAVECVKLAREFIRHGADVLPVMTPAACRIIHPDAMWFATGNRPVTELTGDVEHVSNAGEVKGRADLLLIAPATANTIAKVALAIDDTPVTTFATTAIGSGMPVMIVPAMHGSMYKHPQVLRNVEACKEIGISFVSPKVEESKAKMADTDRIVAHVMRELGEKDLACKKVLVIGGATAEPIDDVRVLTNTSSGRTATALSQAAFMRGAEVELWIGAASVSPSPWIRSRRFSSIADLIELVPGCSVFDTIIVCAAISDFTIERKAGKLPSDEIPEIRLCRAPKILEMLRRENASATIVGFKLEPTLDEAVGKAKARMAKGAADMMIANAVSSIGSSDVSVALVTADGDVTEFCGSREKLAEFILDAVI